MKVVLLILVLVFPYFAQQTSDPQSACKERGRHLISNLPRPNVLRYEVESGVFGDRVRKAWMDKMNALKIKHVGASVQWSRTKDKLAFKIKSLVYRSDYFGGSEVKDRNIHKLGLDFDLMDFILDKAKSGWNTKERGSDIFYMEIFDDEALPVIFSIS